VNVDPDDHVHFLHSAARHLRSSTSPSLHKRAHLKDGSFRDFVLIARGYITKTGGKRTQKLVTLPAAIVGRVAAVLAAPERDMSTIAAELGA
jgi:hypothetical protein